MPAPILPGAEPLSVDGGPNGALVLHGFTGNPGSMRGVAEALAEAGFSIEMPLLPGHGTAVEDMMDTTWRDWLGAAEAAYQRLAQRCEKVVIAGLSMGGGLTAWLGSDHPEVAGLVFINALVEAPEGMQEIMEAIAAEGTELIDGIGADIADPDSTEAAYSQTPVRPLLTLFEAADELSGRLERITSPALIVTSVDDHVVQPSNSDTLAERVAGPVERLWARRSYHVVTLDYDRDEVIAATVAFARKVTA
jgi:carboxylesterase